MSKGHKQIIFHDYPYMIQKLRDKGLIIDDERLAVELLKSRGYYNLINRYKSSFSLPDKNEFQLDTRLTDLYYYHRVEDDFRNILFKFTIAFEQRLKEAMAFILAKKFGVHENSYLNPLNFRKKNKAKSICTYILDEVAKCNDYPTKYYKDEYGYVPPWILLSNLSLGQTRMLFSVFTHDMTEYVVSELLPIHEQIAITQTQSLSEFITEAYFENKYQNADLDSAETDQEIHKIVKKIIGELIILVRHMISLINDFRNNLAHGNRLLQFHSNTNLTLKPLRLFAKDNVITDMEFFNKELGRNDLFSFMISLVVLMDKYDSLYFITQLQSWIKENTQTEQNLRYFHKFVRSCDLPVNFDDRLQNIQIERMQKEINREFDIWM